MLWHLYMSSQPPCNHQQPSVFDIVVLTHVQVVRIMAAPQVFFDTQHLLCGQHLQPADGDIVGVRTTMQNMSKM